MKDGAVSKIAHGAVLVVLGALLGRAAGAAEPLRVGKAVAENFGNIPLDVGMKYGMFQDNGLAIEELNFAGGAKLAQGVAAGAVDIALSGGPDMSYAAKGAPEIAVGTIADSPAFMGISVATQFEGDGVNSLKGRKIGVTSAGSTTYWLVDQLNRAKHWSGADQAVPVVIGGSPAAGFAALKTGQIDADVGGTSTGYQLEEQHAGRLLIDCSQYVDSIELFTVFASTALVQQNPDALRRFLKAWYQSVSFMKSHKAETVPLAASVMNYTPGVAERMYDTLMAKFSTDGKFDTQALETLQTSFVDMKMFDKPVDLSKLYTTAFLPKS